MKKYISPVILSATLLIIFLIVGAYIYKFGSLSLSDNSTDWANLATYLSGLLSPLIGAIAAFYAFRAFQSTQASLELAKETADYDKLNATLEAFYKIYDGKFSLKNNANEEIKAKAKEALDFFYNASSKLNEATSEEDLRKISSDISNRLRLVQDILRFIPLIDGLVSTVEELQKQLPPNNSKLSKQFTVIAKLYIDKEMLEVYSIFCRKDNDGEWLLLKRVIKTENNSQYKDSRSKLENALNRVDADQWFVRLDPSNN
jgi:phosphate/sulfate permease